ncbi:MAG: hypothetical protein II712_04900 [Erysipelotrichaceae bacterium]|nr:hypothetical protein [Erysipelotrichaceae bacterium]
MRYSTQQVREYVEGQREIILGDLSELLDEYDFLINGNQYRLQRQQQQLEEAEVEITRSSEVIYHNIVGDLNGSDVKAKTAVSGYINGVLEQIELPLVRIDRITKPHWIDDLEIAGFFEGDEHTEYFQLPNGEELSIHQESPIWPGYQHDILVQKGLTEQYYQITEGRWVSDYQPEGDHHVRKALYSGNRLVSDFRAVYQLTYKTRGYKGKVICRSDADAVNAPAADRKRTYIIKAIVRYRLVESR